ncbi:uncharacterized protein LOC110893025, partial [Olea europaea subsp. europaea]
MTSENPPAPPQPTQAAEDAQGDGHGELLGSNAYPIRLSSALRIAGHISLEGRQEFTRKCREIFAKRNKTAYEKDWLNDYMEHQDQLFSTTVKPPSQHGSDPISYSNSQIEEGDEVEYGPENRHHQPRPASPPRYHRYDTEEVKPADLNKLFVKPETFNGVKPSARQWLDQYEKAATSNGWSDNAKVKYMATFLKDTAYSWLTEIVPLHAPNGVAWPELRALFVRCYLGESDRQSAKREFDRAIQRENEKAAQFIPRMVQMIKCLDPTRKQEAITDDIRHKLLPHYQEKLIMFELKTINHLYDACTKIEAGMAASMAASKQRAAASSSQASANESRSRRRSRDTEAAKNRDTSGSSSEREKSPRPGSPASKPTGKTSSQACHRCGRTGHWIKECRAKSKLDGTPLDAKSVRFNTVATVSEGDASSD